MEQLPKYLKQTEAKSLRRIIRRGGKARDIALFELLLGYGPRASEVGMLRLSDLDLEENTITLPRLKNGRVSVWPLFTNVKRSFQTWLEQRDSTTPWVFPGAKFKGLSRKTVFYLMKKYSREAGIPKNKRHPHACRHYAAVNALEAGLEIIDVQDLLGHRAIASTMVYAQITSKRRTEAAKKLERYGAAR